MTIHGILNHSMAFSDNESHILNKIARSPGTVTAYELSSSLEKDYSTIHKACKKMINDGILESVIEFNDKKVEKKILKFTTYGFCLYFYTHSMKNTDQLNILKNWKHLHESFDWVYSLILSKRDYEVVIISALLHACQEIIGTTIRPISDFNEKGNIIKRERTLTEIFELVDDRLYGIVFEKLFRLYRVTGNFYWEKGKPIFTLGETAEIIKKSKKGRDMIRTHIGYEIKKSEVLKKFNDML